ncbi:hypothetical protein ACFE04_028751 [Oxalis oulophora]
MQQTWRSNAIRSLNETGGFSRSLVHSCTDRPCLLLELLSQAAEIGYFQPKLVISNIEVLKHAVLTDDATVSPSMYHDSLIWRIIALGANERCLPVILLTSNSYYSYHAFMDFGFPDIFVSRETFGWSVQEAKMHMVPDDYFSNSEVGLLYAQRDPSLIRPVSRGIQRCLVRWLVQEQMQMSPNNLLEFKWQRAFRGRSYRHLMLQLGYK